MLCSLELHCKINFVFNSPVGGIDNFYLSFGLLVLLLALGRLMLTWELGTVWVLEIGICELGAQGRDEPTSRRGCLVPANAYLFPAL